MNTESSLQPEDEEKMGEINEEIVPQNNFSIGQKFFSELIGTSFLVLVGCVTGVFTGNIVAAAIGGSFIVCSMIYIFAQISGAHFNPAVSIPMFLRGKITGNELIYYLIAQTIGAFIGSIMVGILRKGQFEELGATRIQDYLIEFDGNTEPDIWCYLSTTFCEVICTFILVMVIFGSTVKRNRFENLTGIIIGFTLAMLTFTAFNISGASFNPARSLAPALLQYIFGGDSTPLKQIWIYILGPIFGGVFASLISIKFS